MSPFPSSKRRLPSLLLFLPPFWHLSLLPRSPPPFPPTPDSTGRRFTKAEEYGTNGTKKECLKDFYFARLENKNLPLKGETVGAPLSRIPIPSRRRRPAAQRRPAPPRRPSRSAGEEKKDLFRSKKSRKEGGGGGCLEEMAPIFFHSTIEVVVGSKVSWVGRIRPPFCRSCSTSDGAAVLI